MKPVLDIFKRELHTGQTIAYATTNGYMGIYNIIKINRDVNGRCTSLSAREVGHSPESRPTTLKFPSSSVLLPEGYAV